MGFGNVMISFVRSLNENETIKIVKYLTILKKTEAIEAYELGYYDDTGDGSSC
jgi:hypothetical protein